MRKCTVQALGLAIAFFLLLILLTPSIPQPQRYHDFAEKREFFGLPNAPNVVANFPFMVIGLIGLVLCHRRNYFNISISLQGELWGWTCFYVAVTSVAFGSSYYHLGPDDAGLVWDSLLLEMSVAFVSLLAILIIERFFGDIRLYVLAQGASCIAIPLMATLLPPMYTHSTYWLWTSGFYLLATLQEAADRVIYILTFHIIGKVCLTRKAFPRHYDQRRHLSCGMISAM
ncbi:hypothetical protein HKD37_05G013831 [Glycine soja]|nr:hypothetical protein GmHk_05G014015 [Glycine max]